MTGDSYSIYDASNATAALFISESCRPLVITSASWRPEPVIKPPKRNRVPFYRSMFDLYAPAVIGFRNTAVLRPKWKPLMGRRKPCRD